MCGDYFNLKAGRDCNEPEQMVSAYHLHIYFEPGTDAEQNALDIAQELENRFPQAITDSHPVGKVGPHSQANIGVTITPDSFGEIVSFLQLNRKDLSILVHPRTGDEWVDHQDAAMWIGPPVDFNDKFFEPLRPQNKKTRPGLK
ncbi:MAG: 4,5-dioxygenase [Pseudomonadota bacterium]|nr:MAG: 4,5-dioxygenase [Pseudomonadota bacterium]